MIFARGLPVLWLLFGSVLGTVAVAQQKKISDSGLKGDPFTKPFGGDADRWLNAVLNSNESLDSSINLDRLSYFHLSEAQLRKLRTAAEEEQSDEKRLVLWQALRQSRDAKSRDYLIEVLVKKSNAETQIQFMDGLRNPTRFDIPILVALYNNYRPVKAKDKNPRAANQGGNGERDAIADFGDLFDLPRKIVELTCHSNWASLTEMTAWEYRSDVLPQEKDWLETRDKKWTEADLAQSEMIHWLIKNGFEDEHRVMAYRKLVADGVTWRGRKISHNASKELIKGLEDPEWRAKAVPLVTPWIEPSRFFLGGESEVVRLSAIEAMETQVLIAYSFPHTLVYWDKIAHYKPVLRQIENSDDSPKVRAAAKELQARIAETEEKFDR